MVSSLILVRFLMPRLLSMSPDIRGGKLILAALPRQNLVGVHEINLFQCTSLGLNDTEVYHEDSKEQAPGEDITISEIDGRSNEWGKETDQEIPKPVRCRSKSHAPCAVFHRINFGDEGPDLLIQKLAIKSITKGVKRRNKPLGPR